MKLVLIREEPQLFLFFLIKFFNIDGLQIEQQLLEEPH